MNNTKANFKYAFLNFSIFLSQKLTLFYLHHELLNEITAPLDLTSHQKISHLLFGCSLNLFNRYYNNLHVAIYLSNFMTRSIRPTAWRASLNTYLSRFFSKKLSPLKILGISVSVCNSANWSSIRNNWTIMNWTQWSFLTGVIYENWNF